MYKYHISLVMNYPSVLNIYILTVQLHGTGTENRKYSTGHRQYAP